MSELPRDGLTWEECSKRWSLSQNAVRTRAQQLNIPVAYINKVAHWPGDLIEFGDAFHDWRSANPHAKVAVSGDVVPCPEQTKEQIAGVLAKKGDAERAAEVLAVTNLVGELKLLQKGLPHRCFAPAPWRRLPTTNCCDQGRAEGDWGFGSWPPC